MKYYETSFEEYIQSRKYYNTHSECDNIVNNLPTCIKNMPHIIIYGPSGTGKYTQSLSIIQKYSPSGLRYDKKIYLFSDKYPCLEEEIKRNLTFPYREILTLYIESVIFIMKSI